MLYLYFFLSPLIIWHYNCHLNLLSVHYISHISSSEIYNGPCRKMQKMNVIFSLSDLLTALFFINKSHVVVFLIAKSDCSLFYSVLFSRLNRRIWDEIFV